MQKGAGGPRGQLSLFFIVGAVVLIATAFILYVHAPARLNPQQPSETEQADIQTFVEACLRQTVADGVSRAARQGGYISPAGEARYGDPGVADRHPEGGPEGIFNGWDIIPYGVRADSAQVRDIVNMTLAIKHYTLASLPHCLDWSVFTKRGMTVSAPNIDWETIDFDESRASVNYSSRKVSLTLDVRQDDVVARLTYPVHINQPGRSFDFDSYVVDVPIRLQRAQERASRIATEIAGSDSWSITLRCTNFTDSTTNIQIIPAGDDAFIDIIDASPLDVGLPPLHFRFGVQGHLIGGGCGR